MAEQLEVLPELVVEDTLPPLPDYALPPINPGGSGFGYQQNIENEMSWPTWTYTDRGTIEAFAPPVPQVLPEVVVTPKPTAPKVTVPLPLAPIILPAVPLTAIVGAGIALAMETFRRPDPEPVKVLIPKVAPPPEPVLQVLPEVQVIASRPPRAPPRAPPLAMPGDPWPFDLDPLEYYPELPGQRPFLPLPGVEPGPGTVRIGDPRIDPAADPTPTAKPAPAPGRTPQPSADPFDLVPVATPGFAAGPRFDLGLEPTPRTGTRPGPRPPSTLDPFEPLAPPIGDVSAPSRPRAPTVIPPAPDLVGFPDSGFMQDPLPGEATRPTRTDGCNCAAEKKKPKKKRSPRAECWRGTYVESSRGLKKTRRERVPC